MGNFGSNRYDVFPKGSYSVGDTWHVVDAHLDYGTTVNDCNLCGGYDSCYNLGPWFSCPDCPGGYSQSTSVGLCWTGGGFVFVAHQLVVDIYAILVIYRIGIHDIGF